LPQGLPFAHGAANLIFAAQSLSGGACSRGAEGQSSVFDTSSPDKKATGDSRRTGGPVGSRGKAPRGGSAARSVMSNLHNHAENATFSAVAGQSSESCAEFIPILPADLSAGDESDSAFQFLGSKTDPILHVSYPSPWNLVADFAPLRGENPENHAFGGQDSNWRASLKYGRTIYDADYALDHDQSKRRMLYITPHFNSSTP